MEGRRRLPSLAEEIVQGFEFNEDRLRSRSEIWTEYEKIKRTLKYDIARWRQCRRYPFQRSPYSASPTKGGVELK